MLHLIASSVCWFLPPAVGRSCSAHYGGRGRRGQGEGDAQRLARAGISPGCFWGWCVVWGGATIMFAMSISMKGAVQWRSMSAGW
jgi:hypothetical protein